MISGTHRDAASIAGGFLLLYGATISRNLSLAHDSIRYIQQIDSGEKLWHPHHLLFGPLAVLWIRGARLLGIAVDSAVLVGALNAVAGALALYVTHLILVDRLGVERAHAVSGTLGVGLSFAFWYYSGCVEVYLLPQLLLLISLYMLTHPGGRSSRIVVSGLAHAGAILFHEMSILFAPAAAVALIRRSSFREARRSLVAYAAIVTAAVLLPYLIVSLVVQEIHSWTEFWDWIAGYTREERYWRALDLKTPLVAGVGLARSFIGGHFLFRIAALRDWLQTAFSGQQLADEAFLVRDLGQGCAIVLAFCSAVLAVWLASVLVSGLVRLVRRGTLLAGAMGPVVVWLVVYVAVFCFWVPFNVEFWIPQSVCLWFILVVGVQARGSGPGIRPGLLLAVILIGLVNLLGSILWTRSEEYDRFRVAAVEAASLVGSGDLVISPRDWILTDYYRRFTRARVASVEEALRIEGTDLGVQPIALVRREIEETRQNRGRVLLLWNCAPGGDDTLADSALVALCRDLCREYESQARPRDLGSGDRVLFIEPTPGADARNEPEGL